MKGEFAMKRILKLYVCCMLEYLLIIGIGIGLTLFVERLTGRFNTYIVATSAIIAMVVSALTRLSLVKFTDSINPNGFWEMMAYKVFFVSIPVEIIFAFCAITMIVRGD